MYCFYFRPFTKFKSNQIGAEQTSYSFKEVFGILVDARGTNTAVHSLIEASKDVKWLLLLCLSNVTINAGKETGFPTLSKF